MKNTIKITYKTRKKPTGLARIGAGTFVDCKIKSKIFAIISNDGHKNYKFQIQIAIINQNINDEDPAPFKWVFVNKRFDLLEEAKFFLESLINQHSDKFNLHFFDNN